MINSLAVYFTRLQLLPRILASQNVVRYKIWRGPLVGHCSRCSFQTHTMSSRRKLEDADDDIQALPPRDGIPVDEVKYYSSLIPILEAEMRFSEKETATLIKELKGKRTATRDFQKVVALLQKYAISRKGVMENPFVLTQTSRTLESKLRLLDLMKPRDINDFLPLLRLSTARISKISQITRREAKITPGGNRIYYISDKINLSPSIVAKFISKRTFMLEMQFEAFKHNLENMVEYNVEPMSMLKDLWAFRYTPKSVRARLERAKNAKKDKIMPWMVRCPERILQRSLKLTLDEKKLLGENETIVDYVAKRLGFDKDTTKAILEKHPAVFKVRVTKIKTVLDYLLGEGGFNKFEVAQNPRIFCHSLKTTKARMKELASHGCRPTSLIVFCKSQKEYQAFLTTWINSRKKFMDRENGLNG